VEVIGAGFGRTGTRSLKEALEILGFGPCHHMEEVLTHPETVTRWLAAGRDGTADWDALYAGYRSTTDWPGARFWRELASHYPAARVILTVRDPGRWYDSVASTIATPVVPRDPDLARALTMVNAMVWDGVFGGRFADRDHALRVYAEHQDAVRREIPAGRLLEFDVAQGWAPLCDYLGVPVPDVPFPRLNDRDTFLARRAANVSAGTGESGPG
jgi:Sulfotransferase domain